MKTEGDSFPGPGLVKLSGVISGYHRRRESMNFSVQQAEQGSVAIAAIGAALTSLSGASFPAEEDHEEEADHVFFFINGETIRGWVWRSPFKNGDQVEVVAQWRGDHFEALAIARPSDRTVALYPHCSRGRGSHFKNALFWFAMITLFQVGLTTAVLLSFADISILSEPAYYLSIAGLAALFGLMVLSLARQWSPYVQIAEEVFRTFEWPNPSWVDLVKSSKAQRPRKDKAEFGALYFRY